MKLYGTRAHDRGFAHLVYWHDGACDSPLVRCACVRAGTRSKPNALQMLTARIPRSSPPLSVRACACGCSNYTSPPAPRAREMARELCDDRTRALSCGVARGTATAPFVRHLQSGRPIACCRRRGARACALCSCMRNRKCVD